MTPEQLNKTAQVRQALIAILRLNLVSFYPPHYADNEDYKIVMESNLTKVTCLLNPYLFDKMSWEDIVKTCVDGYAQEVLKVR